MTAPDRVLDTLIALERALHEPALRRDRRRVDAMLPPEFTEHGRSGRAWTRDDMLAALGQTVPQAPAVHAEGFDARRLAPDVVLLTYRSAHRRADGRLEHHALRSSVWLRTPAGWRLRFHQGTPTGPFEPGG